MGIELELAVLLLLQLLASSFFARFEVETPPFRKLTKWLVIHAITIGLYYWVGHWALWFPALMLVAGTSLHFWACRKHGFDPFRATPRREYYRFRGWKWEE